MPRHTIGGRRTFKKHECRTTLALFHTRFEERIGIPELQHLFVDVGKIELFAVFLKILLPSIVQCYIVIMLIYDSDLRALCAFGTFYTAAKRKYIMVIRKCLAVDCTFALLRQVVRDDP